MIRKLSTLSLCLLVCAACGSNERPNTTERSVAPGANDRYATAAGRAGRQIPAGSPLDTTRQDMDDVLEAADDLRELIERDLVRRVLRPVVPRVTIRRGVGDHDGGISGPPERPLVRPSHTGE